MIWWRGRGLWIGYLAFGPGVAAAQLGATRTALAYAVSAVLIFLMRDLIGRESALFSIPTVAWPPLLLGVALLFQFSAPPKPKEQTPLQKAVAQSKAALPGVLGSQVRIDGAELDSKALHYDATSTVWFDSADPQRAEIEHKLRRHYCEGAQGLRQANVSVELNLVVPPKLLNDRLKTYVFAVEPAQCGAVPRA